MGDPVVAVDGLGKRYRISHQMASYGRLTEALAGAARAPFDRLRGRGGGSVEWLWALQDVSFEVAQGEVVGIVGRNGAGKTTLLKVLSRITEPTEGSARIRGRVASLLEVGTGFHPELTGRENIFLSGSILGMRRREIERRFDEIVAFAEVDRFLDTPVKRYSSGMSVRLGFAVAAHLEPEILIVDEVLAVGDAAFQRKCLGKMEDASHEGRTILFVSHNMPAVESLCTSGLLLAQGQVSIRGTARDVVNAYLAATAQTREVGIASRTDRHGDGRFRFVGIESTLRTGADSEIRLRYEADEDLRNVEMSVAVFTSRGEGVTQLWTASAGQQLPLLPRRGVVVCHLPRLQILPGTYVVNVFGAAGGIISDWILDAATIEVEQGDFFGSGKLPLPGYGSLAIPHSWSLDSTALPPDE